MKTHLAICLAAIFPIGCKRTDQTTDTDVSRQPSSPRFEARYDRANPPERIVARP